MIVNLLSGGRVSPPALHVVAGGLGGRHGRAELPGRDDGGAALLHGGQEGALQPGGVVDDLGRGLAADGGVGGVGELGGAVVAPDDHVLDLCGIIKYST